MKVTYEFDLSEFKAWSGGAETLEKIRKFDLNHPGAMNAAQQYMEECLGNEATEVEINDMRASIVSIRYHYFIMFI